MFDTWEYADVIVSYIVGTGAGIYLFKRYVQEEIIQRTIDTLVKEDFCRAYINEDGDHELYKWYELEDVFEQIQEDMKNEEDDSA